jgi:hypothetical protein
MPFCPKCNELDLGIREHTCPPIFECSDGDDDWRECRARNHEDAAEKIAEEWDDHGDGPSERTIYVRKQGMIAMKKFNVTFEYSINYSADEVEDSEVSSEHD